MSNKISYEFKGHNIDKEREMVTYWQQRARDAEMELKKELKKKDRLIRNERKLRAFKEFALYEFKEEWNHDEARVMESFKNWLADK